MKEDTTQTTLNISSYMINMVRGMLLRQYIIIYNTNINTNYEISK